MLKKIENSESEDDSFDENQMEIDQDSNNVESVAGTSRETSKKKKRGIVFIPSIPKYMNVTILREMLSEYAKIGRIFLQPGKLTGECSINI